MQYGKGTNIFFNNLEQLRWKAVVLELGPYDRQPVSQYVVRAQIFD